MLYDLYEMQRSMLSGASAAASFGAGVLQNPVNPFAYLGGGSIVGAALEVFAHATAPHGKPAFGLDRTVIDGRTVAVREEIVCRKPFGQLKRFVREGVEGGPKLLIVAPMSGHYATLLRGTVERMLPSADVYVTDWRDARQVPLADGSFDLEDYVDYLIAFLGVMGGEGDARAHMLAVCQPSVPCYAAVALMNADAHPNRPRTLTMMGGPIDTRQAPTSVNTLATQRPFAWFEQNAIATVPLGYPGAGRRVYPGFLQLAGFMSMNLGNHLISHWELFKHLVQGEDLAAQATKDFYDEYRSVCDMTAEFYLQTIELVFQRHALPSGAMTHRGRAVDPAKIVDTALMAIEGSRDDISGLGQTRAALTLATALPDADKAYLEADTGHYGIFNGSKWRDQIAPALEAFIAAHDEAATAPEPVAAVPETAPDLAAEVESDLA